MKFKFVLILFIFISFPALAQDQHRWKPLLLSENDKLWYDASNLDTANIQVMNVWILQLHKPPLQFESIAGDVYRSKTLYTIDMTTVKYGIAKVIYFNVENKEIYSYDYKLDSAPLEIRFPYPVLEGSFTNEVIKEYFRLKGENIK